MSCWRVLWWESTPSHGWVEGRWRSVGVYLEGDGVDDALALHPLEARLHNVELRQTNTYTQSRGLGRRKGHAQVREGI